MDNANNILQREQLLTDWLEGGPTMIRDIIALVASERDLLRRLRFDATMKTPVEIEALPTRTESFPPGLANCCESEIGRNGQWVSKPITLHTVAVLSDLRKSGGETGRLLAETIEQQLGENVPGRHNSVAVFPNRKRLTIGDVVEYTRQAVLENDREAERLSAGRCNR